MRLQLVTWRDAHFDLEEGSTPKDFLIRTVGWTKRKGRWLVITSERQPKDRLNRAVTRVPLENVVERKDLS